MTYQAKFGISTTLESNRTQNRNIVECITNLDV